MSNKMLPSGISVRVREDLIDGVSRTQTTIIVDPLVTLSGHRITMADIGTIGYGKIDQGKASEEIISWTGITDNVTTYTLTGCTWGVNFHNLENSTANIKRHVSGAQFAIMTDMHYIAGEFRDNADNVFTNTDPMEFQGNEILLGDGTSDNDKVIKADNGDANEPFMAYDEGLGKWVISNDGVNSYDPEQGGSGVTAGDGIDITGGEVSVDVDELVDDEMLEVTGNRLGTVINEDTGLFKDANGLNIDVIDPDNPVAQTPAQLIGGDDVVLQNFIDLGLGDNDGRFTTNIDGVEYEDLNIDLFIPESNSSNKIIQEASNNVKSYFLNHAQSFNSGNLIQITAIKFKIRSDVSVSNTTTISLRQGVGLTGQVIATVSAALSQNSTGDKIITATFSSPINVLPNTDYTFTFSECSSQGNNMYIYYQNSDVYSNGHCWLTGTEQIGYDLYFDIVGKYLDYFVNGISIIAPVIQTAIRTATGNLETVVWDTDHFEITSTILGKNNGGSVLKLTAPTTGTDISGAGYLDLGANATEVAGDGDDYKLVRLDEEGLITNNLMSAEYKDIYNGIKILCPIPTDTEKATIATEKINSNTGTNIKDVYYFIVYTPGKYRIKFECKTNGSNGGSVIFSFGGVDLLTHNIGSGDTTYAEQTYDVVFPSGIILVKLRVAGTGGGSNTTYVKNLKLCYDYGSLESSDIVNTITEV